jgi:putative ATP-dependent endonuclease of OLD family
LESLIVCNKDNAFPMGSNFTNLHPADYTFLERFLDATKANLFFARGVIIVEGDAENLLIPTIAEIIGHPLHKYGVSIVNVGSTAYKRYANIFVRKERLPFDVNVAIISDLDIRSLEYYDDYDENIPTVTIVENGFIEKLKNITQDICYKNMLDFFLSKAEFEDFLKNNKTTDRFPTQPHGQPSIHEQLLQIFEVEKQNQLDEVLVSSLRQRKKEQITIQWKNKLPVEIFPSEQWTLEYEIASSKLYKYLCQAIELAKREKANSDFEVDEAIYKEVESEINKKYTAEILSNKQEIYDIFKPVCKNDVSKAVVAQYLAAIMMRERDAEINIKDMICSDPFLKYIVDAIYYATGSIITKSLNPE